jgi:methylenetetrahydrofolate reductase (NADPH)
LAIDPLFVDFTWGAGGSTSDLTMELSKMAADLGYEVNMHLTCTNMAGELVDIALESAKNYGIRNILALRGDPPKGQDKWVATEGGFNCALDLVKHIREKYGDYFGIGVAGYPEGHPDVIKEIKEEEVELLSESEASRIVEMEGKFFVCKDEDYENELKYLKAKVDAGASLIITQLFYDVPVFLKFVNSCREIGITVPILPGIMPITQIGGFRRMTGFCKTRVPKELNERLDAVKEDVEAVRRIGREVGIELCKKLLDNGITALHFYTLNTTDATFSIMDGLQLLNI